MAGREQVTIREGVDPDAATLPSDASPGAPVAISIREDGDPLLGRMLGHFRVDAPLGRGGMGAVYRAWDTSLERAVALKTLLLHTPGARARFLREARAQAKLRHPHVVPIHFVGEEADVPGVGTVSYLVMDLVEGESLAAILRRAKRLDERRALDVVESIADALEAAHRNGLIHRDVKPSNVLVEPSGRVLLADFGLARDVHAAADIDEPPPSAPSDPTTPSPPTGSAERAVKSRVLSPTAAMTAAGAIVGTPTYLAPEQAAGDVVDHRADMYALGVTLYELLAGEPPFTAGTQSGLLEQHRRQEALPLAVLAPEVRPPVEALVVRLMAKAPEARFATYEDLRAAIVAARAQPLVDAPIFARGIAFGVDFTLAVLVGAAISIPTRTNLLAWVVVAVGLGALEGVWGRTPGKRLMGLCTVDRHAAAPSIARSIVRTLVKLWGPLLDAAVELAGPTQTVGRVITAVVLGAWLFCLLPALGRRRAALHDRLTRTRVVSALVAGPR